MKGYIKLHREIEDHWLWLNPQHLRAWLYLLFEAAWEPKTIPWGKNETVTLRRGQLATTTRKLMGRWGYYAEATLDFLKVLEAQGMITRETSSKMTIITIVNYDKYQVEDDKAERKPKHKSKHIKEIEEEKINNINLNISPSREQDLKFFEELKNDKIFFENAAMSLHIGIEPLQKFVEQFGQEMLVKEKFHLSLSDYRQHFYNWVKLKISNEGGSKKINLTNGTGQTQTTNKLEARRGTDAASHTPDDYTGSF